ncbi:WYL domain-containing protein [bacterium SCSIO 12741]|nr:WYL domain-containing protein [bacterium SCSIO 12741]
MPVNRNALIRYKTLDKCLQNRYRKWTLDDLIEACSEALYDYEGIDKGVSKRSVQADIQMMRSDKLGYNAPIIVVDRKYYTYEDPNYSITNIPLTDQDLSHLSEAVEFMKQFQGFSHFRELDGMVQKLEDHIYSQKTNTRPVIDFEKNEDLKGLEHLDFLYQSIINKKALRITYQSFKARQANSFDFHPFLLKEYRNRWFLMGRKKKQEDIMILAIDRIVKIEHSEKRYRDYPGFDALSYFKHAIGVTVAAGKDPVKVTLLVSPKHAPYVLTKPLHPSQKMVSRDSNGAVISMKVQHNFELEKEILAFGDGMKVIAPDSLKQSIRYRLKGAVDMYDTELSEKGLVKARKKLKKQGYAKLNQLYTSREIRKILALLDPVIDPNGKTFACRRLLQEVPDLSSALLNQNMLRVIRTIDPKAFLTKAIYFDKPPKANWYVTWHQDVPINVNKKKEVKDFTSWTEKSGVISVCPPLEINQRGFTIRIHLDDTDDKNGALKVVPGSHQKRLTDEEIRLITTLSNPYTAEVPAGGVMLMKPLLLHASAESKTEKRRRVIHLEFNSRELPKKLDWAERLNLEFPIE